MRQDGVLLELVVHLMLLSLLAIGGVNTILPELHRWLVVDRAWLTNDQFTALFALAQAAPGPNLIFITLIGWQISGLVGALTATAAICGPATLIAYMAARLSTQWQHLKWFRLLRTGLVPVTTGLMISSAFLLTLASAQGPVNHAITGATALVMLKMNVNPLCVLVLAAALGAAGWI